MYASVIVDIAHSQVDRLFTYHVREDMPLSVGQRVLAPFGAGNRSTEGFVLSLQQNAPMGDYQIKTLIRTLEPYAVLSEEQIQLAWWIRENYHCTLVDALRLMIPAELRGGRVHEKTLRIVTLPPDADKAALLAALKNKNGSYRAPKQGEVMELLLQCGHPMSLSDICAFVPGAGAAAAALLKKGYIVEEGFETYRDPFANMPVAPSEPKRLTSGQQAALQNVCAAVEAREGTLLLHGVTGSGKTEVYMQAIADVIARGGTAIVLVPEIALTPQTVQRFRSRFDTRVAVLHSRLSAGERFDEWRRIRFGKVSVVVGARSAVFAPLADLRLIVIDEEHEPSYISESVPRYHAVETAAKRCKLNGAALLLGSATPTLQSYYRALHGRYTLLSLPERINNIPMPQVKIVDMRQEFASGNTGIFSGVLQARLRECVAAGEQAILFINRRGYSTFVSCRGCGYVFKCDNCDVSMTYHKHDDTLRCHYCGSMRRLPKVCPECGKPYIKFFGIGTQQVEEALYELLPGVRALRMDMDTTRGKNAHYELLSRFTSGEAQVLVGTQMVAKGLDIPNVTLVGVVAADATLHIPDYRSAERTFQLTTQVAGRAGRDNKPGYVVIQTYTPEHPAIQLSARHDYPAFYAEEIEARRLALFPPFAVFARILFTGEKEEPLCAASERCAKALREAIREALRRDGADERELLMLYAAPAPVARRQGLYRYQVLLKLARTKHTAAALDALYAYTREDTGDYQSTVEVNPMNLF